MTPELIALRKLAKAERPKLRRRRPGPQLPPTAIEREYSKAIIELAVSETRRSLAGLMAELPKLLSSARRRDSASRRRQFMGFAVVVENPAGSVRRWVDSDGTRGETEMLWDYGYLENTTGADGDGVDVYLGPDEAVDWVYVVRQNRKAGGFKSYDEDKVMLGWPSADAARAAYLAQYDDPAFFGGMEVLDLERFRRSLSVGGKVIHLDAGEGPFARRLIEAARDRARKAIANGVESIGVKFGEQVAKYQKKQLDKQIRRALGVDLLLRDRHLQGKLENFAAENASLIKTLQEDLHNHVEKLVTRAISDGRRHEDVAEEIESRFEIGERHSRLIARDQLGKLYGQVNAARQQELGIRRFIWRTVDDERTRDEHAELERRSDPERGGEPFDYDDPPNGELPGEPIQCRCYAEPVFADLDL